MKPFSNKIVVTLFCLVAGATLTSCATKRQASDLDYRVTNLENKETPTIVRSTEGYVSRARAVPAGFKGASMSLPTGSEATSALLIEKHVPAVVNVGAADDYVLYVTNLTSGLNLKDVVVTETLDGAYTFASAEPAPASTNGRELTFALGNLAPGDTKTINIRGRAVEPTTLEFCSTATYTPFVCIDQFAEQPSLALRKEGPAEVLFCDPFDYKLIVTNSGTGAATGIKIVDPLPAGITTVDGNQTVTFDVASLAAGQSQEFSIRAKAARTGEFVNAAAANADGLSAESNTVTTRIVKPALDITMTTTEEIFLGGRYEYNIGFTNTGDATSDNVVVAQTLPACVEFISATNGGTFADGKVVWNVGSLAAGQDVNATVTVRAAAICTAESTVTVVGNCADPDSATVRTEILGIPAILLEVIDEQDPVRVGDETTYVITATNQGSAEGTNIKITATTENQQILEVGGATAGTITGGNTVTFAPFPALDPKAEISWRVRVRATAAGDIRFSLTMNSDQLTRDVKETEATTQYE